MSISTISTDTSAVWSIYQFNPTQPSEPPNFGQYVAKSDASATSTVATTAGSGSSAPSGKSRIGADLNALLLDLQSTNTKTGADSAASTPAAATGAATTSSPGTGDVVSDLNTFFSDLQSAGSAQGTGGVRGAGHHHRHGSPPALQGSFDPSGTTPIADASAAAGTSAAGTSNAARPASTSSNSSNDLLGYIAKALQNYGSFGTPSQTQSSVALSA